MIATGGRGRSGRATVLALLALLVNAGIAAADEVAVQRADYVIDAGGTFLSVEARADSAATALTLEWDSGPATAMGSGGSAPMAAVWGRRSRTGRVPAPRAPGACHDAALARARHECRRRSR